MVAFGKSRGGGRRSSERAAAPLLAIITTLLRSHSAVVVNVSTSGARLSGSDLPAMGDGLVINIDGVQAFGTVVWSDQGEAGIEFDPALSVDEEMLLQQQVALTRGLPLEMKTAFESWVIGCAR
jgi:hypothetical protein